MMKRYSLASQGIFRTVQGEGALLGIPMTFIRLAGCSIGCPLCDTDYAVKRRVTIEEICSEIAFVTRNGDWVWITGGEPTDHDLEPLISCLSEDYSVAVATAGHKKIDPKLKIRCLSVSPHSPEKWIQDWGTELKIVPGLNGYRLKDFESKFFGKFEHMFVSPCEGDSASVEECVSWIETHPEFRMTVQAHKLWGMK